MSSQPQPARPSSFQLDEVVEVCDVCGGRSFVSRDNEAAIVECRACGYRFVNPRPSQAEIAAAYSDEHFYDGWLEDDAGRQRMWRKRLRVVERRADGRRILDVGAGIGTFLWLAQQRGFQVVGSEVSESARQLARRRYGLDLLYGQAEQLRLGPASFDVITLWHVLEHVPSPTALLQVCHTALKPGGALVIALPNDSDGVMLPNAIKGKALAMLGKSHPPRPRYQRLMPGSEIHLSHFTPAVLKRLLDKTGFTLRWLSVDDHYPDPSWKTDLRVAAYRLFHRLTGINPGDASLLLAERR